MNKVKTSYRFLKTTCWYGYIKECVLTELINETAKEIENKQSLINSDSIKNKREEVNKLEACEKKLKVFKTGKVTKKQFTDFILKKEKSLYDGSLIYQKRVIIDKDDPDCEGELVDATRFSEIAWDKFSRREQIAENSALTDGRSIIDHITDIFPQSQSVYFDGPMLMFRVFESVNFRDAVSAYLDSLSFAISEAVKNKLLDQNRAKDIYASIDFYRNETNLAGLDLLNEFHNFNLGSIASEKAISKATLACLNICHSFIRSKFLGESRGLAVLCFLEDSLEQIESEYHISRDDWFNLKVSDENKVLEEFVEAQKYFEKSDLKFA